MNAYDEADFGKFHVFRSVVNMFDGRPRMQRLLNHSLGLQYDYELGGDDMDAWIRHQINIGNLTSCGCGHGRHSVRPSSFTCGQPTRSSACSPSPVRVQSGDDDTERKARLLQESKKDKARAEKKKKKKLQKKERKRREKLKKEKQDAEKKDKEDDDGDDGDAQNPDQQECVRAEGEEDASCRGTEPAASENQESSQSEQEWSDDDDSSASEELDLTSSFVNKAALIAKRQLEQKPKAVKVEKKKVVEKECNTVEEAPGGEQEAEEKAFVAPCGPSFDDIMKISTDLAVIGNQCASTGDYVTAVRYFTDAIKYNPTEFKLFGNRSLCFEKMHEYEKALADAELSLGICPGWVKGLFRKGRALAGLQRYDEAAAALKEVLKLDVSCAEAAQELMRIQIIQLMDCGFTREQSSNALIIHGTVEKALEVLSKLNRPPGAAQHTQTLPTVQVANVNGVSPILSASTAKLSTGGAAPPASPRTPAQQLRALVSHQPAHPFQGSPQELFPVWVGNLDHTVSEPGLTTLFNRVGTVCSVKVLTNRRCAFINFAKPEDCEQAIQRLNGYNLNGIRIVVRYPDRLPPGMGISASAHRAGHAPVENSFHKKSQAGTRRPV